MKKQFKNQTTNTSWVIDDSVKRQRGSFDHIPRSLTLDTDGADLSLLAVEVLEQAEELRKQESKV